LKDSWISRAEDLISEARNLVEKGVYWLACFLSHQAVEFYLKGILADKLGFFPFTHDLVELLREIKGIGEEVPTRVFESAELLTPHYLTSRYPGKRAIEYDERRAKLCLMHAEVIVNWARKLTS